MSRTAAPPVLGLRANAPQFWLLVVINGLVGSMVGLERSVLPLLAEREFGLASATVALSFIVAFGLTKAAGNLLAGRLADRVGRRRLLIAGWLAALPVPALVIWAPSWGWIVAANVLLGVNQGLAWSMTVVMKIDLVGPRHRGLALGLNEAAGYVAVALVAMATAALAAAHGPRPVPFLMGFGFAGLGLALSLMVRDTAAHVALEQGDRPSARSVHWRDPTLYAAVQAGLVNNLNDAMAWGLIPIFLAARGLSVGRIGVVAAAYPLTWGLTQLGTGALSDRLGRKPLVVSGMLLQAAGIGAVAQVHGYGGWLTAAIAVGLGTALVYPTLIAVVGDCVPPGRRASAIGVYRLWRDLGFVIGAVAVGVLADLLGARTAIHAVAGLTAASGVVVAVRMTETAPARLTQRVPRPGRAADEAQGPLPRSAEDRPRDR